MPSVWSSGIIASRCGETRRRLGKTLPAVVFSILGGDHRTDLHPREPADEQRRQCRRCGGGTIRASCRTWQTAKRIAGASWTGASVDPIVSCALAAAVAALAFDLVVDARPTPLVLVLCSSASRAGSAAVAGSPTAVVAVIFIPVKRYSLLPSALPFGLDVPRLIALVAAATTDVAPGRPPRPPPQERRKPPMILFGSAAGIRGVNGGRIAELGVSAQSSRR